MQADSLENEFACIFFMAFSKFKYGVECLERKST